MGYGNRCPTCLRPFSSNQTGKGTGSHFSIIAKRAMAREMGKEMAEVALRMQRAGYTHQLQTQKGSGALKTIVTSKPVRGVGKAAIEALASRAIQALAPPKKRVSTRRKKTASPRKKTTTKRRKVISQIGGALTLLSLLATAAPLIGKTVGLGSLGALVNHGVQKALGG